MILSKSAKNYALICKTLANFRRDKYAYNIKFDVNLAKFLTTITPNFRIGMDKFAPNLGKI